MKKSIYTTLLLILVFLPFPLFSSSIEFSFGQNYEKSITNLYQIDTPFQASFIIDILARINYPFFVKADLFFLNNYKEIAFGSGIRLLPAESNIKLNLYITFGAMWLGGDNIYPTTSQMIDLRLLFEKVFFLVAAGTYSQPENLENGGIKMRIKIAAGFYF